MGVCLINLSMNKTLIIIRHAHRDKDQGHDVDNGLSEKGQAQALRLLKCFRHRYRSENYALASSPKRRCIETVLPLVGYDEGRVQKLACLDEGGSLKPKIEQFLQWWNKQQESLIVICSHGDWIPEFIELVTGESVTLKKCGWAELSETDDEIKLKEIIQKLPD